MLFFFVRKQATCCLALANVNTRSEMNEFTHRYASQIHIVGTYLYMYILLCYVHTYL